MRNNTLFCLLFVAIVSDGFTRVRDFQTTRLKSTGGAGVGSLLMNEAAVLNPASVGFFTNSSIYIQQSSNAYEGGEISELGLSGTYDDFSDTQGVIIADTRQNLKGAFAYTKQQEGYDKRERFSGALAAPIGPSSTMGIQYRQTEETYFDFLREQDIEDEYGQLVFGVTHVLDENFTVGAVAVDPFKMRSEDTRAIIGLQYVYRTILTFMLDAGTNYATDVNDSRLYRAALQLNVFSDFYVRVGTFEDRTLDEKGNGFGVAWVGPKLVIETSFKTTNDLGLKEFDEPQAETERETSFALSYFF